MFDDSSITDTESLSSNSSVASILGIKGGLRIRHHTASQKAHVILRRVEASGDSSEDGQDTDAVCFRLFAHKPINLKPGKELLLTIASVDGRFKEGQLVMFEGDLRGKDDDSDHEGTTQVGEEPQVIEEEEEMIPQAAMPPKMRRQWTRRVEEVSPVVFKPPVAHASVGVQTQPISVSSLVQTSCDKKSVSIQVKPVQSFASVQTCPSYTSSAVQADPPPLPTYNSLDIQTEPILSSFEPTRQELEHAPSSTPMQLASPETSPLITPPSLSIEIPCWIREPSEDMLMSPSDVKVEEIEETLPLSWDAAMKIKQEDALEDTISLAMQHHRPPPPRPVTDMFDVDDSPETWMPLPPPIKSGRAQNPFVSGGFVTDFVGSVTLPVKTSSPQIKVEEPSGSARRRAAKRARLRAQAQPSPSAVGVVDTESLVRPPQGASDPSSSLTTEPIVLQQSLAPRTMSTSVLHRNTTQNAVASSSKLSPHAPPTIPDARPFASISLLPREVTGRAKEKALAAPVKQSRNDSINVPSSSSGVTPPPDPKALVCIPTGPPSNPLSIRPSNSSLSLKLARPSVSAVAAPKPKKLIVVGRGWPFVRAINGTSPASTCTSAADSQPVATSGAALVAYSSPSPSPEASKPVNKWKRIDTAISIGEDESPDDVVLLDPSSPVAKPGKSIAEMREFLSPQIFRCNSVAEDPYINRQGFKPP
ncbi:hypothetical protein B0H11DRAFT_939618 [Mycena galericulata]|nr:hypothetical protein B0H11DRAFT_939618 [Mycena galericulata]